MDVDPLSVVEAAYRDAPDDRTWLQDVTELLHPLLDRGHGIAAAISDASAPDGPARLVTMAGVSLTEKMVGSFMHMVDFTSRDPVAARRFVVGGPVTTIRRSLGARFVEVEGALARFDVADSILVLAGDARGRIATFSTPRPSAARMPRYLQKRLERVAAHVAAGLRLRTLGATRLEEADAVLSPEGEVHDARRDARERDGLDALRRAAIASERARGPLRRKDPDAALAMKEALVAGRWSLVDVFDSDGRRFLVARENTPEAAPRAALTRREAQVAELAAFGHAAKLIAYELGIGVDSVTTHLARAMAKLGTRSRAELALVFVPAAAGAPR